MIGIYVDKRILMKCKIIYEWSLVQNVPNYWLMGTDDCVTVFDINIITVGGLSKWELNDNNITK